MQHFFQTTAISIFWGWNETVRINNFNPSHSLVLIIPEAAWGDFELYTWYEAESYNIDTPWKNVIDDVIVTCPMCILHSWKSFFWPQQKLKNMSSMNFFRQEDLLNFQDDLDPNI